MKKRILFVIWSFSYGGGAEKVLSSLLQQFPLDQYEIDVWEFYDAKVHRFDLPKEITQIPAVLKIDDHPLKIKVMNRLALLAGGQLRKHYLKKEYDIEIAFNYQIPSFLLDYSKTTICWAHGDIKDLETSPSQRKAQAKAWGKADRIVGISDNTINSILGVFPQFESKLVKIVNGYPLKETQNKATATPSTTFQQPSLCFVGRLDENKNVSMILRTMKQLVEKDTVHLYIIGTGVLEQTLKKECDVLGLREYVHFLGFQSNPYPLIAQATLMVLASKQEGMPTVLAEGMVLGVPFVSTNVGGVDELSDNQRCGFIARNEKEFVNNVSTILSNEEKRMEMSNHGKSHIEEFSLPIQFENLKNLLNEIEKER